VILQKVSVIILISFIYQTHLRLSCLFARLFLKVEAKNTVVSPRVSRLIESRRTLDMASIFNEEINKINSE